MYKNLKITSLVCARGTIFDAFGCSQSSISFTEKRQTFRILWSDAHASLSGVLKRTFMNQY